MQICQDFTEGFHSYFNHDLKLFQDKLFFTYESVQIGLRYYTLVYPVYFYIALYTSVYTLVYLYIPLNNI